VWALYELGIVFARMVHRNTEAERSDREAGTGGSSD
jgi:Sec-independent protein secretion pathway component TatC